MTELALQKQTNSLIAVDPAAVAMAEASKARIQAAYIMAMQKPRNEDVSLEKITAACKRITFAKSVEFEKPVGKKKDKHGRWVQNYIKGLSIRFAEVALKEWGNLLTETQTLYEDDKVRRIRVGVLDLETNTSFSKEIQITKIVERKNDAGREVVGNRLNSYGDKIFIVRATDDELMNKENALISKAVRNEGLRLIPNYIKEEAVRISRLTIQSDIEKDVGGASKAVIDSFLSLGVPPAELENFLGHSLDTLTADEIAKLRGIYGAIKDGEATWTDYAQAQKSESSKKSTAEKSSTPKDTSLDNIQNDSIKKQFDATFGEPDENMQKFLEGTAKMNETTAPEIMKSAIGNVAAFSNAFENWKTQQPADADPAAEPAPHQNGWDSFYKKWYRLRSDNFQTFVTENLFDFERAPDWLLKKAKKKWVGYFEAPWPSKTDDSGISTDNSNTGDSPEGQSKAQTENVPSNANQAVDLMQTDEWNEISMLQERYPDIYSKLAKGRVLKSVANLTNLILDINAEVQTEKGGGSQGNVFDQSPGTGDIPT